MDILDLLREQDGDDLAHCSDSFENGDFEIMETRFVRIGDRVINLANVTRMIDEHHDNRPSILIYFDADNYTRIYNNVPGYDSLKKWMQRQPQINWRNEPEEV